ncbi:MULTISPECIES: bifunctional phosphopantothenoylcysteine decarboxylase/phosphopantothenate--cysteine ligase CoaBC [unclassified Gemella]|uniref:bifunctional phosphopantothenoylcysteine decarboxylase/phosphopantothenate--cysteine ligase CoaBC n=1 Tax=unclassified Gemella TaxID=2624949 RepID=UPI0015D0B5BA|nr:MULTISPECIES: bifunctional phosphopantothenoylcysteine decarboxylase/phosphopantothenate--cysteine ligase CoaBC [unclassified Gemella]MBF0710090.1 bifunctional phosphopantothenoylcysteine decarboxylase/phosphopantothenate--cysteine ligase CoaBC [Gemella sp. GL1.1]NYS27434.1 bifunctional phosphopantothenoylcysteine decarboxylase/phosphopantothenate--cysteine ligase CoaBC [Gemella sp. GL1]
MNILQIVSGGIAVYKAVELTRELVKSGNDVKVIMTENAKKFVTELTFQTISKNTVYVDIFMEEDKSQIQHIDLVKWADKIIIAPATANIIAKAANGISDDLASTLLLAVKDFSKIYIAPAMNTVMYENPITQSNMNRLRKLGMNFIESEIGLLACGDLGKGKLADTETILKNIYNKKTLLNKNILVTAGPTLEYIDPVRYLSNPSTGKMGIAIAEESAKRGANVILVTSAKYKPKYNNINIISVVSTEDMFEVVKNNYENSDVVIKSAAVSDYKPVVKYDEKMKKKDENVSIELERTQDILLYLGQNKDKQILVGFAAETNNVIEYAQDKIKKKNLDLIVANDVSKADIGFASDENEVYIIDKKNNINKIDKESKKEIGRKILDEIENLLNK